MDHVTRFVEAITTQGLLAGAVGGAIYIALIAYLYWKLPNPNPPATLSSQVESAQEES